jgi:hypothetical protein
MLGADAEQSSRYRFLASRPTDRALPLDAYTGHAGAVAALLADAEPTWLSQGSLGSFQSDSPAGRDSLARNTGLKQQDA